MTVELPNTESPGWQPELIQYSIAHSFGNINVPFPVKMLWHKNQTEWVLHVYEWNPFTGTPFFISDFHDTITFYYVFVFPTGLAFGQ